MLFTLSDCRIWLYSIMEYTATQIPFFGEAPETGLPSFVLAEGDVFPIDVPVALV